MKILFICLNHQVNGPRLYYRQTKLLKKNKPGNDIYFLSNSFRKELGVKTESVGSDIKVINCTADALQINTESTDGILRTFLKKILRKFIRWKKTFSMRFQTYKKSLLLKPDLVQASDIREIPLALTLKCFVGSKAIYDAHEDYFNFFYEFSGKSKRGLLKAIWFSGLEWIFIRFFDAVFCTDEYLYEKYRGTGYGISKLYMLRNFANTDFVEKTCSYQQKEHLDIVYIGTVNKYRGLIETADYVEKFNQKYKGKYSLQFDVYSAGFPIVKKLHKEGKINHKGTMLYEPLMKEIAEYDVGLSLLLPIKKYQRNIPMKNFEYMSVGLPVLTSNFGQCQKYIDKSGAGVTIDPKSYQEFEHAILKLFDAEVRKHLGENGLAFCRNGGSFEQEAQDYLKEMSQKIE